MTAHTSSSHVRVGVRIRPLTSKESSEGGNAVVEADPYQRTVAITSRKFTYDAVFPSTVSQEGLYSEVASPLLDAFLNGYNATVLAYGQTGSGKTYTMGSEAHSENLESLQSGILSEKDGLIPRFMSDIFNSLMNRKAISLTKSSPERRVMENNITAQRHRTIDVLVDYSLSATFLEVYGEDIHDLLDEDRKSLPVREDSNGEVIVAGLRITPVSTDVEAMNVLNTGTMNRTTAATLMNCTSSRSHAVFTVYLQQKIRSAEGVDMSISSRFTFVDLAGSERMKKTGAEGERMKEGIRINEGLLALGNVINALADDERLSRGEKVHVPYRQSKLTRLLQDALGGNSQTLFLACVSPSDTNASESLSTLQYANRARNIKNAPTQNVDAGVLELQRLRTLTNVLMNELMKQRFDVDEQSVNALGEINNELLQREDIIAYMNSIQEKVNEMSGSLCTSSPSFAVDILSSMHISSTKSSSLSTSSSLPATRPLNQSVVDGLNDDIDSLILDVNPEEDIKILDELLELQHHDLIFRKKQQDDQDQLDTMEGEIEAQEERLNKLRENIIVYHSMKEKYERLISEVQSLESEKQALAIELAKAQMDPSTGCSSAIKKKLQEVEENLTIARSETRKHQQMYRQAEQEAQKCKVLERKIHDLKHAKVNLIKKQKEDTARHRELTNQKTREIQALKRKEKSAEKKITKIEAENDRFKYNLERSRCQNEKLSEKLKQTESHLIKLLTKRRNALTRNVSNGSRQQNKISDPSLLNEFAGSNLFAPSNEELSSIKVLLEKAVSERVTLFQHLEAYEVKVLEHGKVMQSMAKEVSALNKRKRESQALSPEKSVRISSDIHDYEENIQEYQLKLELVEKDLDHLRVKCPQIDEYYFDEDVKKNVSDENNLSLNLISKLDGPMLRTLIVNILETQVTLELQRRSLKDILAKKEQTICSFEQEIKVQNATLSNLSNCLSRNRQLNSSEPQDSDFVDTIKNLQKEYSASNAKLKLCQQDSSKLSTELEETRKLFSQSQDKLAKAEEKLALVYSKQKLTESNNQASKILSQLQEIFAEIGLTMEDREPIRKRLLNCVEDTCTKMLGEALALRDVKKKELNRVRTQLKEMCTLLGLNETVSLIDSSKDSHQSIQDQLDKSSFQIMQIRSEFDVAYVRYTKLISDVETLISDLHPIGNISPNLNKLMSFKLSSGVDYHDKHFEKSYQRFFCNTFGNTDSQEKIPWTNESFDYYPEGHILSISFLDSCEKDIKRLRLLKSDKLLTNVDRCEKVRSMSKEMQLDCNEVTSIFLENSKRWNYSIPEWWEDHIFSEVSDALFKKGSVLVNERFTNHLTFVLKIMEEIADRRQLLSTSLKEIIEQTHKILLSTAEGCETAVKDLYQSLHEALFNLPQLSRHHIKGCIDEMQMLVTASESIAQSEIETLTVLWEGLNHSSNDRGIFWSQLEESATSLENDSNSPFNHVLDGHNEEIEEWVRNALQEAMAVEKILCIRVYKLQRIHVEVKRLKGKQDAKNEIMSLNSELNLLSAKLIEFEENAGNKDRLTNKKVNSATLLEEERFRKQMQTTFSAKLEALGKMLNSWEEKEGLIDDSDMLGEVVKNMLENSHRIDAWMNEKTRFMHLRTTQVKAKIRDAEQGSNVRSSSKLVQRSCATSHNNSRSYLSTTRSVKNSIVDIAAPENAMGLHKSPNNDTQISTNTMKHKSPLSDLAFNSQNQSDTDAKKGNCINLNSASPTEVLLPFGALLVDTPVSKENYKSQF